MEIAIFPISQTLPKFQKEIPAEISGQAYARSAVFWGRSTGHLSTLRARAVVRVGGQSVSAHHCQVAATSPLTTDVA